MPVLRELLGRELLMLVVLAGLGAGPAAMLSSRFGAVERVALAPVLGMCVGTSVFTTLIYFFRASDTAWLIPVLVVVSVGVAGWRSRRSLRLASLRADVYGWASIVLVVLVVTVPLVSVLRSHHTVGPVSYAVGDAIGYVAETDGMARQSLHQANAAGPPFRNSSQHYYISYAGSYQNLDVAPIAANVNSLVGLNSTATWEAFLIAFVAAGALGALAAVRWVLRSSSGLSRTLSGAVAGTMFAGALYLQLYFADSEAALCGMAVLLPLGAVAADAATEPRARYLALTALLVAGLFATYPLFVAPTAVAGAAALLFLAVRRWRSGTPALGAYLWSGAKAVAFVVIVAVCLNLVSFVRDLRYWKTLVSGGLNAASFGFPVFDMRASTLPAWLLQTRNLFTLTPLHLANLPVKVEEIVVPLLLIGLAVLALRRFAVLWWLVVAVAVAALLGEYEAVKNACSYCTDRSLLPIGPALVGLVAVGFGVLWTSGRGILRVGGLVILAVWIVPAFKAQHDLRTRVTVSGTFLEASTRAVLTHLPAHGSVAIEGFDADPAAASPADPFAYELADEQSGGHATLPGDVSNYNGIAYFGVYPLNAGQFNPDYRYVVTRLPGIATARQTIARSGGVALQKRVEALDAIVDGGAVAPPQRLDPSGDASLSLATPLRLVVAGGGAAQAFVGVRLVESVPVRPVGQPPGVTWRLHGRQLVACVPAEGTAPFRVAQFSPFASASSPGVAAKPLPAGLTVQIAAIRVAGGGCPSADSLR